MQPVRVVLLIAAVVAMIVAGYYIPHVLWPRTDASNTVKTALKFREVGTGNSRMPCRGPNKTLYVFGYTMFVSDPSIPTSGSGSVCWDIFNSRWDWRVDPPYEQFSSDRSRR